MCPQPDPPDPDRGVSRQLEIYRDSTKWLVTIAGAAIVLGLGWVAAGKFGTVGKVLFSLAGVTLLFSSVAGILAIFKMADYESSRQTAGRYEARSKKDRSAANLFFKLHFVLFSVGLFWMTSTGIWLTWFEGESKKKATGIRILNLSADPSIVGVIVDRESDKEFLIKQNQQSRAITVEPEP